MIPTPAERCSILIVDDMEENLVALEAVLGPLDQRLVRARSGEETLKAMLREEFAVVVLDVLMPGMDGFETAENIKHLEQTKDVPIILLTGADPDTDYAYRGYVIGAADFLTKPFDPWLLRTKVSVLLDLYRKNRQLAVQTKRLKNLLANRETAADRSAATGEHQMAQFADRLTQLELLLRDRASADSADSFLADRVGELERALDRLRVERGA